MADDGAPTGTGTTPRSYGPLTQAQSEAVIAELRARFQGVGASHPAGQQA